MKQIAPIIMIFALAGCTTMTYPTSQSPAVWEEFGQTQALDGELKMTETGLMAKAPVVDPGLYQAYSSGYDAGLAVYCNRDPYEMGISGEIYRGICDGINPSFADDYNEGMEMGNSGFTGDY
ncbi:DUF2799 domain-containing protein [Vibrio sp. SM6]|uniref:DUF2799 domain-containing protein n=1 Tax=Vibrio agarilyticus TaxID=2726741 RepID=A0A7X8YHS5_9VIBR|nr:DUF2799 domain-containing protein [Vibrio agarilyticus]NLS13885.1 DUF2799 domain-containing protein [Vibrio agarilyticus]